MRKHKLNEMKALNMKQKKRNKLDKSESSSCSLVVFKHCNSLETHLELWRKIGILKHLCFSKNSKVILICIWILKKSDYSFFLLNSSFSDIDSIIFCWQSWYNGIEWKIVMCVCSVTQLRLTLCNPMDVAVGFCPWDFAGKNTGVCCNIRMITTKYVASLVVQLVKNPLAMQETLVWFLSQEDTLEMG